MKWYSTHRNDQWVAEVFNYKKQGYFVEIGAANGYELSSCYALEKELDWDGVAVEPNSEFFKECKIHRKNALNACVYTYDGTVEYTECKGRIEGNPLTLGDSTGLSGITTHLREYHSEYHNSHGVVVDKQSISPTTLLKSYNAPLVIDYVGLDTEGSEFEILNAWPWNDYIVRLISVEADHIDANIVTDFLNTKGYTKVKNPYCEQQYEHHYCHESMIKNYKFDIE